MKVLIDTDILLDILTKREPHYLSAAQIWTLLRENMIEGHISAISVNNLYYIIRKLKDRASAEAFIDQLIRDFEIIPLTKDILRQARTKAGRDHEDLIQYFSAIHAGCEFVVTRNKKDYPRIGVKTLFPREFLRILQQGESQTGKSAHEREQRKDAE